MRAGRSVTVVAVLAIVTALAPAGIARAADLPSAVVWFRGHLVVVEGKPTVERAVDRAGAHPRYGNLLDIRARVIRARAYAPAFFDDGRRVPGNATVHTDDTVDYADAHDRVEPSTVRSYAVPEGNPAFFVDPWLRREETGTISHVEVPLSRVPLGRAVALTFDDGPDPTWTPAVLSALKAAHAKATFFVIGRRAARYPALARREVASGMQVGDHTWDHPWLAGRSVSFARSEIGRTKDFLQRVGVGARLFRPPYESYTGSTVSVASGLGLRTVVWSIDPQDWRRPGADAIVANVLSNVRPGSIVLMHDGGGDRSQTIEALRRVLSVLRSRGYRFVSLR